MKTNKYILTLAIALCCAVGNLHAVDKSYYNSLNGKSGTTLREAMTALVYDKHTTGLGYNWVFEGIDWDSNGNVYDIYSDCGHTKNDATDSYKCCCDAINREHIVPQSTFGSMYPQYADRHHLFVVDGKANGYRSDFAFGECSGGTKGTCKSSSTVKPSEGTATCTNHEYGKLGTSTFSEVSISDKVYEPKDEYKGDIARAIMYMVIRYATTDYCKVKSGSGTSANSYPVTAWSGSSNVGLMFSNNLSTNYGLSNYGKALLMKWHRADPVSAKEIARNSGVEAKQGNRNPFIDLPDLAEYLWGTHAGESVPLSSLDIATGSGGGGSSSYQITLNRHGVTQTITCTGEYTLPTSSTEVAACTGWAFAGWSASSPVNTPTAPTFKNSVTSSDADKTFYAVYSHTTTPAPVRKAKMAEEVVYTLEPASGSNNGYAGNCDIEIDGITWNLTGNSTNQPWRIGGKSLSNVDRSLYSKTAIANNVTKIEIEHGAASSITINSMTVVVSQNSNFSNPVSTLTPTFAVNNTVTVTRPDGKDWSNCYYKITYNVSVSGSNNKYLEFKRAKFYAEEGGSSGGGTTTYKTSPDCGTAHTITLNNGGSATGGDFFADVTSAYSGATVTLTAAPDDGNAFNSWSVTNASTSEAITVTNNQFTMPDADVNVSATFTKNPEHTITFYINDKQVSQQTLSEGLEPEVPAVPDCDGYTFVGWYPSNLEKNNTTEYDWISNITVGNGNESFYAIYSKTEGGGGGSPTKATSVAVGDQVILVYETGKMELNGISTGNTKYGLGVSYSTTPAGAYTLDVVAGNKDGTFGLKHGNDYLNYSGSSNTLNTSSTLSDNTSWTITFSSGNAVITNANSTTRTIRWNNTSGQERFACYTSGQQAVQLYSASSGTTYYTSATGCDATADCTGKLATPVVTAVGSDGKITLTWPAITGATDYEVTIGAGAGYTTECGSAAVIGSITGTTTKTCVITGLTNGLAYTTNVVANASSSTCDSDADEDTATPQDCNPWDDPTLSWNKYSLNTTTNKTATKSLSGTTHGTLSFESSDTDVLTVNSSGTVTAVGAGEATVTAHWTANGGYCEKTMTSSTFEVAGPLTISFNANADGVTGSMTDQTVTYKVSTAIKDNAFRREGYTFIGWATSADGEKVYNDKQSVAFTNSQTLYAVWQLNSRTVSFTSSITGATVTVNGQTTNQTVAYGSTVTVHITPANHYTITTVSIKGATSGNDIAQTGSGETRTFTMPDENVTVSVTMSAESTYTATFYNSGVVFGVAQMGYADDDINAPATNPVSCDADEFTFVGWVAAEQTSETTTKPEVLTFPQTMPVGNVSYYALYRRVEGSGGGEATVTFLTASSDGNTAYTEDDEIKENLVESYSGISSFAGSKAYIGKSGVKLGASGGSGYITLNLSSPITTNTITVSAAKYGTDTGNLQIEVNGSTSFGDEQSPADGTLTFTNASDVEISDLTISTTSKRAYVASISLGGGGTSYYTTSPVCTPCDYHVTLTKGAETNGTFTLSKANGTYDNCKTNFAVTVSNIVPATGYYCSGVSATGGSHVIVSEPDANGNYTVSFPKGNMVTSTVTAVFEEIPSHTVTWSANGNTSNTASYKEGATITFPESATGCDGMEFKGWSAVEVEPQDYAPEYTTSATMGTEDITFYAVFATASSGGGSGTELLNEGFNDNAISDSNSEISSSDYDNFPSSSKAYEGSGGIKLGSSKATGYITSKELDLSSAFTVSLDVKKYGTDGTDVEILIDDDTDTKQTVLSSEINSTNYTNFEFNFSAATSSSTITIQTSTKRAYVDNIVVTSGGGGGSTTYSGYTTSCTPCDKQVNIVKGTAEHGSFELSITGSQDNCHSAGVVVTVTDITATGDYQFKEITQEGIATGVTIDNDAKTVTYAKDVTGTSTITVVFEPKPTYTVRFFDSGTKIFDQQVVEGNTFTKPSNPAGCEGYEFQGWWGAELAEDNTTAYSWLNSFGAVYSDKDYYAVFKHVEDGSGASEGEYTLKSGDESGSFTIVSGVTGEFEQNDGQNPPVWNTNAVRAYSKNSLTITSSAGNLTSISFTFASGGDSNTITVSTGTYSNGSWSGDASSVTFTIGGSSGHRRFQTIAVGGSGTTYYTTETDCRTCSEPTITFDVVTVNKFDGDAPFKITPNVTGNTMGVTVSYSSSNPSKAEVSADGTVTIHDAMSTDPITITATLEKVDDGVNCQKKVSASYTLNIYNKVTWLVNGSEYTIGDPTSQTTEGGQITTYPTDPDGSTVCGGKTFMGWTTAEYEESDTPPTTLYTGLSSMSSVYITQGTTFYAVFADEDSGGSGGGQSTTYEFTITSDDFTTSSYADNNGEHTSTATDVTDANNTISVTWTSNQVYSSSGMQWQKSNGYIYNNTDLGKINSVTVTSSAGSFTTYYGSTVQPNSSTSLGANDGYFNIKTGSSEAGKTSAVTVNFTTSSSGGGSVTTYSAYSTTCGLCMPKPEITSTVIKSDRVTITWKAVTDATGYEFTCSGGTVKVTGTTATITGLTPLSDYTYSVCAQGGDPYSCFRTTNGSFSTPDCDDVPYDITVTPYNVVQAIIRWKAEAERAKVVVYKDEACTQIHANIADTISPCYVSGLAENTRYWFKVFGGASQDCESPVQTFLTQTTAVELVEWRDTAIVILLTGDETTASVLIEDKNDNATNVETNVANNLFFSKYYEASGNVKLWAVYNGTAAKISLEKVKVQVSSNGAQWGYVNGSPNANATTSLASFGHKETGYIYPGEEIIVYNGGSSTDDGKVIECMAGKYGSGYNTNPDSLWYLVKNNTTSFSGDDGLLLLNGTDTLDIIGGLDYAAAYDSASTYPGWGDGYGWNCDDGTDVEGKPMKLSTNRCILVRKNTVKDGMNAVAKNKTDFVTLCEEWWGSSVPKSDNSQEEIDSSCDNFSYVGHYDYQDYYASFEPVDTIENLTKNDDGTITIPIPGLDTMSCSMLRVNVYDTLTGDLKASREYRVPIIIQKGEVKSTNKLFTKHGVAVCKECDVLVYSGAKLIKDNVGENRDTIGNLTLYPGSTLELPDGKGAYHVKSLTYRVEGDSVPVTKLSATDHLYTETQRLVVSRRIKNDRYYFISFPYDVNVNEITLANGSKAVNGKDFRLMEYDSEARATEGSLQGAPGHWKLFTGDKLTAGQGYAIAVNTKAMKEIMFPMTLSSKNLTTEERTKTTNTVAINEYVGEARNTNHNWNLIAHPYITKFEVTVGATPGTTNVEAYWEHPSRQDSAWVDDWNTWPEDDPTQPQDSTWTQPTDTTSTQPMDTTETHIGDIIDSGTLNGGAAWVLYANGTMELNGSGMIGEFGSLESVPWGEHREKILYIKITGNDLNVIDSYAFAQCNMLTTVTITAPVSQINAQAFAGCNQLTTIRIESHQFCSASDAAFDGIDPTKINLQVQSSLRTQYKNSSPWKNMSISAISTTGNAPRRVVAHPDGWKESPGGIYVTIPVVKDGKVGYDQYWINEVADIKPFTAVFIQGDGQGQMTFSMYPATPAPKRMLQADPCETRDHTVFVGLTIHGNGQMDKTSLRLRPDFSEEYKLNLDLLKFTTFYTSRPQIYFKTEKDQLAFRAVSDSLAANTWLPVGVYCRDAGEYTFALHDRYVWDEVEAVYLRDNVTGAETNLLMGNYTITTTGQIYTNTRFAIKVLLRRKVKDTPTMIDHTEDPNAPRKFFRDGLLYIMRDGKVYDLTGKPVQFDDLLNR